MRSRIILLIAVAGIIMSAGGCGLLSKKYLKTSTEEHQVNIAGKQKVKLDNVNGTIKVTHSSNVNTMVVRASKEIKVKKKFLDTPFDEIKINIDTTSNFISISTEITRKGEDGLFKFNLGRDQKVDYEIILPEGPGIEIENTNGNIVTKNLSNDVKIDVVNGEVELENQTGILECDIVNGSFSATVDSTRGMNVNTVNGSVTLVLSNFMNANVRAETNNRKITVENLDFRNSQTEKKFFKGRLGNGDSVVDIKIETVNGRISLIGKSEI